MLAAGRNTLSAGVTLCTACGAASPPQNGSRRGRLDQTQHPEQSCGSQG